jgi:hypothetical protein
MRKPIIVSSATLMLVVATAGHQTAAETLHAPEAIRACLCLDQAVTALSAKLYDETATYETAKKSLAALEKRADEARRQANPSDLAQRESLGRLLDERDAAIRHFASDTTPQYNAAVDAYNKAAQAFNQACGGKSYDWSVLPEVQRNLVCDRPK